MANGQNKSWRSFVAGAIAGGTEGFITYPFEFAKTRLQLVNKTANASRNPLTLIARTARTDGVGAIYAGIYPFLIGNITKAGVRFLGFDAIRNALRDERGQLSGPRGALAGLGAGVLESIVATTPGESIKTAFIDDRQSPVPRYNQGFIRGLSLMVKDKGFSIFYRGIVPVTMRQAANQTVRLGSYSKIKGVVESNKSNPNEPLGALGTFAVGALVGVITVYATMPIDTVKTRMQSVDARKTYKNLGDCFVKIFQKEGTRAFWRGSTARLGRLILSGGIVFTVYEQLMKVL